MRYRRLGASDLEISEIALGSWLTYGDSVGRKQTRDCTRAALEAGINFFDTANVYGRGAAEEAWGEILSGVPRDSYILATKAYFPMRWKNKPWTWNDKGLSRSQIRKQIHGSLKRLRTDYVDLYQCHRYDESTPLEETMSALTEVVQAGMARYIGFSEWPPEKIQAALAMSGVTKFVSSQPQYSLLWREPETEVFPLCKRNGISQIVWSPLAQGILSGKYLPGKQPPADSRASREDMGPSMSDETLIAVQKLRPIAEREGISMSQLALAWILREDSVAAAIIGASRPEQVRDNAAASGVKLSDETLRDIDEALAGVSVG